jgi:hypothetical protein
VSIFISYTSLSTESLICLSLSLIARKRPEHQGVVHITVFKGQLNQNVQLETVLC